jgi:hypothetical protein
MFVICEPAPDLPAAEDYSGKKYWMISSSEARRQNAYTQFRIIEREIGEETKWIKINGKSGSDHYDIEFSGGKRDNVRSDLIHAAILSNILVDYDPVAKAAEAEAKRKKTAAAAKEAHIRLVESKPWPSHMKKTILENKIRIGMTAEQVTLSWGKPRTINRSVGAWGVHEQWIYGGGTNLYFENDRLTSFQDSR